MLIYYLWRPHSDASCRVAWRNLQQMRISLIIYDEEAYWTFEMYIEPPADA